LENQFALKQNKKNENENIDSLYSILIKGFSCKAIITINFNRYSGVF
tara:strand:- start:1081 stop:1221 length:141 start_codon:yes stop_codon:yes gene_type:complete